MVLLRSGADGLETFMLCRHEKSGFMGGAHVFPGGKLDESDRDPSLLSRLSGEAPASIATRMGEDDQMRAAGLMIAAIRETFEESGLVLGDFARDTDLARQRERLHSGSSFTDIASALNLEIDAASLVPYARWVTPKVEKHRFDARFFLAMEPQGQEATHDGTETTSASWLHPETALEDMRAGKILLAPPTLRTLEWLAGFGQPEEALAEAASRTPPLVRPQVVIEGSEWFLALPGDPAHPEPEQALPGPTRLVFIDQQWRAADL